MLRHAGVSGGLKQAHKVASYFVNAEDEGVMQRVWKKMHPGHAPTWTLVIVKITVSGMRAEMWADAALFHS